MMLTPFWSLTAPTRSDNAFRSAKENRSSSLTPVSYAHRAHSHADAYSMPAVQRVDAALIRKDEGLHSLDGFGKGMALSITAWLRMRFRREAKRRDEADEEGLLVAHP